MSIRTRRVVIVLCAVLLAAIGIVTVTIVLQQRASAPQSNQISQRPDPKPTTFTLPNSSTALPDSIDAALFAPPAGILTMVNKQTSISTNYIPKSLTLPDVPYRTDKSKEEVMVRSELLQPLRDLFADAKSASINLIIGSAYRSAALQEVYFNSYVASDGLAAAERYSAHPGTSEHQTGLAVDLATETRECYLEECFADTAAGKWLAAHAHEYGFILRYMKDKEDVTGYQYEPWHFRYVGNPYATAIYQSGLTYEDALPLLKAHAN